MQNDWQLCISGCGILEAALAPSIPMSISHAGTVVVVSKVVAAVDGVVLAVVVEVAVVVVGVVVVVVVVIVVVVIVVQQLTPSAQSQLSTPQMREPLQSLLVSQGP